MLDLSTLTFPKLPAARARTAKRWLQDQQDECAGFLSPSEDDVARCEDAVRSLRGIKHCLWIGIGGSTLGPKSFLDALSFRRLPPGIQTRFLENPDPTEFRLAVAGLSPSETVVCIVTKSGETYETWALALAALEWLGKSRFKSHVIAVTDPAKGALRAIAAREGFRTLDIAPSVGGRFSIFSAVGYLPMILEGFSAREFVRGARDAKEAWLHASDRLTPLAHELARRSKKRPLTVFFPYGSQLRGLGAWFVQLWGESLAKGGRGLTPIAALGAVDQHSLLQRLQDGANDYVAMFVQIARHPMSVAIPASPLQGTLEGPLTRLRGRTLEELLEIELVATRSALQASKRPVVTWQLAALEEGPLAGLYYSLCLLTALTGHFLRVNPFDQPGVEKTKRAIGLTLAKPKR